MDNEQLKLENQLCFPIYAASRLVIREYQPFLERLGITYVQYLVLLVLWETDQIPVSVITQRLFLNTNTISPILKRMAAQGLITRQRAESDERKVIISLTSKGQQLEQEAATIPAHLAANLLAEDMEPADLQALKGQLEAIIQYLIQKSGAMDGQVTGVMDPAAHRRE
ncbi:MAG: MarR family winged helix-turn-helix transcriptional regulator [Caldilineaceae bacterium]